MVLFNNVRVGNTRIGNKIQKIPSPYNWKTTGKPYGSNGLYAIGGRDSLIIGGVSVLGNTEDLETFNTISIPPSWTLVLGVKYFNRLNKYFIWSNDGKIASSLNGDSFTEISNPVGFQINGIVDNGSMLILATQLGRIYYGVDGTSWTQATSNVAANLTGGIAHGNGITIAAGDGGAISISSNGTSWTSGNSGNAARSIIFDDEKFIIVGSNGIVYSTNGISWTNVTNPITGQIIKDIYYAHGFHVIVSQNGQYAYSMDNMSTWEVGDLPVSSYNPHRIALFSNKWVIVGSTGDILIST